MFPMQLPEMRLSEFPRCDEQIQQNDLGIVPNPLARTDASLKASVEHAIWSDDVLRAIEYYEIDVRVKNGVVHLNGHITNAASRNRIEKAIQSVPGILGTRNHLILDDKLTHEVAGALGIVEHTHGCKFFTGSSHGVISLNGIVDSEKVKVLAEMCAASNPNVRAVINHVRVPGATEPEVPDLPFLQPIIGERIYFLDGLSGVVKRVIINPNNRRVIAMTLLMNFTDPRLPSNSMTDARTLLPVQLVTVSMDAVRYLTKVSGFLFINSNERSRYQDFDPASFFTPGADWVPPYPYCPEDVLFPVEYQMVDPQTANATHQFEELAGGATFKEQFFANDALGG